MPQTEEALDSLSPFSEKLCDDTKLEFKIKDCEKDCGFVSIQSLADAVVQFKSTIKLAGNQFTDKLNLTKSYPNPGILGKLASSAYMDYEQIEKTAELPKGWKLLATANNNDTTNGYFGAVYWNPENYQIVIAHRGTKLGNIGAVFTNLKGIVGTDYVPQMNSASTFANVVINALNEINKEQDVNFHLFFTGHSLGGWLAQITTFTVKYLQVVGSNFQNNKKDTLENNKKDTLKGNKKDTLEGYHAHTVVFDSPGCSDMLLKMARTHAARYRYIDSIDVNSLDITSYLSAVNRINTCNIHIGTVYQIDADIISEIYQPRTKDSPTTDSGNLSYIPSCILNFVSKVVESLKDFWCNVKYNQITHELENILKAFDPSGQVIRDKSGNLRAVEILDFPVSSVTISGGEEYETIFIFAISSNNYSPRKENAAIQVGITKKSGYYPIRYQVKSIDEKSCNVSVFTQSELLFLERYQQLRELYSDNFIKQNLLSDVQDKKAVENAVKDAVIDVLKDFEIDNKSISCSNAKDLQQLIPYVKNLLRFYSEVSINTEKAFTGPRIREQIIRSKSLNYNELVSENFQHFTDGEVLRDLIKDTKHVLLLFVDEDADIGLTRICEAFKKIKNTAEENITHYKKEHIILNLEGLLYLDRTFGLIKFLSNNENNYSLILVECKLNFNLKHKKKMIEYFFDSIFKKLKNQSEIKVILVAHDDKNLNDIVSSKMQEIKLECEIKMQEIKLEYETKMQEIKLECEIKMQEIKLECEIKMQEIKLEYETKMQEIKLECEIKMQEIKLECEIKMQEIKLEYEIKKIVPLKWDNLTSEFQDEILARQLIVFQGQKISLNKLIDNEDLKKLIDNEDLKKPIDSETLVKLIKDEEISIGNKPLGTSDLEGAYAELLQEINKEVLVNNLSSKKLDNIFVISDTIEDQFITNLTDSNEQAEEINNIKISLFNRGTKYYNSNVILAPLDQKFKEKDFQELCHKKPNQAIYWIKQKNENNQSKFILQLQQLYNPEFYLDRQFKNIIIKNDIKEELIKDKPDSFFITGVDDDGLLEMQLNEQQKQKVENNIKQKKVITYNIKNTKVTIQKENEQAEFDKLVESEKKPIHWLHVEDNNGAKQIIWRQSQGSLENLRKYIDKAKSKKFLKENDLIKAIKDQKVLIIADEPGMGKSTSLTKLYESKDESETESKSMLESHWVIRVNLKDHLTAIKNIDINNIDIGKFLSEVDSNLSSKLAQNLLEAALDKEKHFLKPLLIAFDGFDEVLDEDVRDKIISLLKFLKDNTKAKFWITSRLHYEQTLENALSTFATEFEPMDDKKKREFINKFLKDRLSLMLSKDELNDTFGQNDDKVYKDTTKIGSYAKAFLTKMQSVFTGDNYKFIGTPLQLHLMLEGSVSHFKNWLKKIDASDFSYFGDNIDEVYEQFIDRKYDIYFRKVGVAAELKKEQDKVIFDQYNKDLAKSLILKSKPQKNLEIFKDLVLSVGIIKSQGIGKDLEFIHPTFREYFAAQLFTHWIEKELSELSNLKKIEHLLTEILLKSDYQLIRTFMNFKLKKMKIPEESLKQYGEVISKLWKEKQNLLIDNEGKTILHIAAEENNAKIVDILLNSFTAKQEEPISLVFVRDQNLKTALYVAVKKGHDEIVKQLLSSVKNCTDSIKRKLLLATIFRKTEDIKDHTINRLLDEYIESDAAMEKISDEIKEKWSLITLFLTAVEDGNIQEVQTKLKDIGDENTQYYLVNVKDRYDEPILHLAAGRNKWEVVKLLVEKGADVNAKDLYNKTALHLATEKGKEDIVKWLIEKGADVNATDKDSNTALHIAAKKSQWEIVRLLIETNADVNVTDKYGNTVLHLAAKKSQWEIVKLLVETNADVNVTDEDGYTALDIAAEKSQWEIVRLLIEKNVDVNVTDKNGNTVLHKAAKINNLKLVKWLVDEKEADVYVKNKNGETVLHRAAINGQLEVVQWLVKKGADVKATDKNGRTVLHCAAKSGKLNVVKWLVKERGADVKATDNDGKTPLNLSFGKTVKYLEGFMKIDIKEALVQTQDSTESITTVDVSTSYNAQENDTDLVGKENTLC